MKRKSNLEKFLFREKTLAIGDDETNSAIIFRLIIFNILLYLQNL